MKKILFVSHDANRAGAQILLLRFLKKLSQSADFQFHVLLKHGGPLASSFAELAPTFYAHRPAPRRNRSWKHLFRRRTATVSLPTPLLSESYDLVVSNTVTNGELLPELSALGCPVVTYAHELEIGISMYTTPEAFASTLRHSDFFMACSRVQRERYIANYRLDPARIDYLPSLLPEETADTARLLGQSAVLRQRLGLPTDALLVGCMGTFDWRKGIDVFGQLARLLPASVADRPVVFAWVGGRHEQVEYKTVAEDVRRLGLRNRVLFVENQLNPLEYMACFDVFALPSREEPYPLVVLEAALLEKPVVCFDQSGGARELVQDDAGVVCPYLDVECMARELTRLLADEPLRRRMGQTGRQRVLTQHSDERAMREFVRLLEKYSAPVLAEPDRR
jgi:glycosyltransferase involved in cell wall biosynthesis